MKKLFIKLLFILLPIFLLSIAGEMRARSVPNNYSYKNEYLKNNSQSIELLILGSSHSLYGINPDYFSLKSFNAAHVSQTLDYDWFIFNNFKEDLTNLKFILLPISYFTLFSRLEDSVEDYRIKNYIIYYNAPHRFFSKYQFELLNSNSETIVSDFFRSFDKEYNHINCSNLGFGLRYSNTKQKNLLKTGLEAAKRHTKNNLIELQHNLNVIDKFIIESKKSGFKVILITLPTWHTYYENINNKQLNIMNNNCNELSKNHSNVYYFNFLKDNRFNINDFRDGDHLNGIGSKKLTIMLDHLIKEINLKN